MRKIAVTPILLTLATAVFLSGCDTLRARIELNKGNTYYKNEQYKDALIQFQKGLALDPDLKFALRSVALSAMLLYRPGQDSAENTRYFTTAVDAFKKYLAAFPQDEKSREYLMSLYEGAKKYDELMKYLQDDLKKNPGDLRDNKAIVSIYLRTQKIKEAYDWITTRIPNADAEPYYLVSVYCWDKAYRDPTISLQERGEFVDLGLTAAGKALQIQTEYFDAMIYTNLLYREKAKLQTDEKLKQEYFDKADEFRNKALALRERLKKQPLAKS